MTDFNQTQNNTVDQAGGIFSLEIGTLAATVILVTFGLLLLAYIFQIFNRAFRHRNVIQSEEPEMHKRASQTFRINPYQRYCGVEIECIDRKDNVFTNAKLHEYGFSQKSDGSLSSGGVELVSAPMNGDLLFQRIDELCGELIERTFSVDTTCGLHIHMEIPQDIELIKKLYVFYTKYEPYFFSMVPKSRQHNSFCKRFGHLNKFKPEDFLSATSYHKLAEAFYETKALFLRLGHYDSKRYCWVNFHSVFYRNTLEIRSHSGTIDAEKIKNWFKIHLRVLEFVEDHDLKELQKLLVSKKKFLSFFPKPTQKYIVKRWNKFAQDGARESDLVMPEVAHVPNPSR